MAAGDTTVGSTPYSCSELRTRETRLALVSGGGKVRAGESVMKWSDAYDPTR